MKTRISKHGKYQIIEGTYGEIKDLLQLGDILRTLDDVPEGMKRSDFDARLVRRIPSQEIMDQVMENLSLPSKAIAIFAMMESPTEGFSHSWALQDLKTGIVYIWSGEYDDTPCAIKRPISTGETATTEPEPEPELEPEPKVPTEPGLYKDSEGDYVLFHYVPYSDKLYCTQVTVAERLGLPPRAFEVEDISLQDYTPYTRVTAVKDAEVEQ